MVVSLKHNFVSTVPNDANSKTVGSLEWNEEHNLTMSSGYILGRTSAGEGAVEEIAFPGFNWTDPVVDSLQFTGGTGDQGTLSWNTDEETVDIIQNGAVLQVGQEVQIHCRNNTGSDIPNGTPVMATGTLGASGRITIAKMDGTNPANAKYMIGITTEDIANDTDGKVTAFGKIRHLDTTDATIFTGTILDGDVLWVDPDNVGKLTKTEPTPPDLSMPVAFVIHAASNGTIFVRITPIDEHRYAEASHTHAISDVTNLQTTLDSKASTTHTHELDELDATGITDGYVLTADGVGNAAWEAPTGGGGGATGLSEIVEYTSSGTFTKASYADAKQFIVTAIGPGGDGDGANTAGGGYSGGGGGGGGVAVKRFVPSDLAASITITINASSATFAHTTAVVGNTGADASNQNGGAGGTATGGDQNYAGQAGGNGATGASGKGGTGGSTKFGHGIGGQGGPDNGSVADRTGAGGYGYGGGGGGGGYDDGDGGTGAGGAVIIEVRY